VKGFITQLYKNNSMISSKLLEKPHSRGRDEYGPQFQKAKARRRSLQTYTVGLLRPSP
jgi:hypothetical protein